MGIFQENNLKGNNFNSEQEQASQRKYVNFHPAVSKTETQTQVETTLISDYSSDLPPWGGVGLFSCFESSWDLGDRSP